MHEAAGRQMRWLLFVLSGIALPSELGSAQELARTYCVG